jgi:putative ABC transport system permease protein
VRYRGLTEARFDLYKPYLQSQDGVQHFIVKPSGESSAFTARLRATVRSIDPGAIVDGIRPMRQVVTRQTAPWRFAAVLFSSLGALALVIAVIGLYAMLAYQVVERTREIGIRMALGARQSQIVMFMTGRAVLVIGVGLMAGLIAALLGSRAMNSLVFGVGATNAVTYGVVCVILLGTATAGAYWPVRRAASVDPLLALKEE